MAGIILLISHGFLPGVYQDCIHSEWTLKGNQLSVTGRVKLKSQFEGSKPLSSPSLKVVSLSLAQFEGSKPLSSPS